MPCCTLVGDVESHPSREGIVAALRETKSSTAPMPRAKADLPITCRQPPPIAIMGAARARRLGWLELVHLTHCVRRSVRRESLEMLGIRLPGSSRQDPDSGAAGPARAA